MKTIKTDFFAGTWETFKASEKSFSGRIAFRLLLAAQHFLTRCDDDVYRRFLMSRGDRGIDVLARLGQYSPSMQSRALEMLYDVLHDDPGLIKSLVGSRFPEADGDCIVIPPGLEALVDIDDGNLGARVGCGELAFLLLNWSTLRADPGGAFDMLFKTPEGEEVGFHIKDHRNSASSRLGNPTGDGSTDWCSSSIAKFLRENGVDPGNFGTSDFENNPSLEAALLKRYDVSDVFSAGRRLEEELDDAMRATRSWGGVPFFIFVVREMGQTLLKRVDTCNVHFYAVTQGNTIKVGLEPGRYYAALASATLKAQEIRKKEQERAERAALRKAAREKKRAERVQSLAAAAAEREKKSNERDRQWIERYESIASIVSSDKELAVELQCPSVPALRQKRSYLEKKHNQKLSRPRSSRKRARPVDA